MVPGSQMIGGTMKTRSFFQRHYHSSIPRFAGVTLVALLALAWTSPALCDEIHDAAWAGDLARVKMLIEHNPNLVFSKDNNGDTPLHLAANRDVAELLLANRGPVNVTNYDGDTPLHKASGNGHTDVVELLMANGARVNAKNKNGDTPLHEASGNGHIDVVKLLMANAARVN